MAETVLMTPPAVEPVSLAEARLHLRIDDDNTLDDARIARLIKAAREQCEHAIGRRLITQSWEMFLDIFPSDVQALRLHSDVVKAQAIEQILYVDTAGVSQLMSAAAYVLDPHTLPGYIMLVEGESWPTDVAESANAVRIRVTSGYGSSADDVPDSLKEWILMRVDAMYCGKDPGPYIDRMLDVCRVGYA